MFYKPFCCTKKNWIWFSISWKKDNREILNKISLLFSFWTRVCLPLYRLHLRHLSLSELPFSQPTLLPHSLVALVRTLTSLVLPFVCIPQTQLRKAKRHLQANSEKDWIGGHQIREAFCLARGGGVTGCKQLWGAIFTPAVPVHNQESPSCSGIEVILRQTIAKTLMLHYIWGENRNLLPYVASTHLWKIVLSVARQACATVYFFYSFTIRSQKSVTQGSNKSHSD